MWKKLFVVTLAVGLMAGCAQPRPPAPAAPVQAKQSAPTPTPRCTSPKQCEAMWAEAQNAVGVVSRMRIRFANDTRIETFPANDYARMGGTVTRIPVGGDAYEIRLALECYTHTQCADTAVLGRNLFNTLVTGAGITFQ